ncbi:rab-GTPase-TBC domain-containing protein [Entophlyctis helioformis]|nr:rab-GTPase-TBC domain-containing protein [Entophlyctis helioformis]
MPLEQPLHQQMPLMPAVHLHLQHVQLLQQQHYLQQEQQQQQQAASPVSPVSPASPASRTMGAGSLRMTTTSNAAGTIYSTTSARAAAAAPPPNEPSEAAPSVLTRLSPGGGGNYAPYPHTARSSSLPGSAARATSPPPAAPATAATAATPASRFDPTPRSLSWTLGSSSSSRPRSRSRTRSANEAIPAAAGAQTSPSVASPSGTSLTRTASTGTRRYMQPVAPLLTASALKRLSGGYGTTYTAEPADETHVGNTAPSGARSFFWQSFSLPRRSRSIKNGALMSGAGGSAAGAGSRLSFDSAQSGRNGGPPGWGTVTRRDSGKSAASSNAAVQASQQHLSLASPAPASLAVPVSAPHLYSVPLRGSSLPVITDLAQVCVHDNDHELIVPVQPTIRSHHARPRRQHQHDDGDDDDQQQHAEFYTHNNSSQTTASTRSARTRSSSVDAGQSDWAALDGSRQAALTATHAAEMRDSAAHGQHADGSGPDAAPAEFSMPSTLPSPRRLHALYSSGTFKPPVAEPLAAPSAAEPAANSTSLDSNTATFFIAEDNHDGGHDDDNAKPRKSLDSNTFFSSFVQDVYSKADYYGCCIGAMSKAANAAVIKADQARLAKWQRMSLVGSPVGGPQSAGWNPLAHGFHDHRKFATRIVKGMPHPWRRHVWFEMLAYNSGLYADRKPETVQAVNEQLLSTLKLYQDQDTPYDEDIHFDVRRTMRYHVKFLAKNGPGSEALEHVLKALAMTIPEIQYERGMNLWVAFLMAVVVDNESAYLMARHLLQRSQQASGDFYGVHAIYSNRTQAVNQWCFVHDQLLDIYAPKIVERLRLLGVRSDEYVVRWMETLFMSCFNPALPSSSAAGSQQQQQQLEWNGILPYTALLRLWDMYILHGQDFLLVASVALVKTYEQNIMYMDAFAARLFLSSSTQDPSLAHAGFVFPTLADTGAFISLCTSMWNGVRIKPRFDVRGDAASCMQSASSSSTWLNVPSTARHSMPPSESSKSGPAHTIHNRSRSNQNLGTSAARHLPQQSFGQFSQSIVVVSRTERYTGRELVPLLRGIISS